MAVPSFSEYTMKRAIVNPDPGGYKAAPYGSFPQDVINDGWGFTPEMSNQNREKAVKERSLPKIDSENVIGSLSGMLGPSPEERAAEEKRLQEHRRKMHGWTALFNGLRHLGNLYYATKGAPGQKLSDPHQQIEQQYQDERKRLADIHAANRNYYGTLYNIRRQMEVDRIANENHQSTLEWRKAQQEGRQRQQQQQLEEKQRQFDERQRQQQQQFEARQKQQRQQFEERQRSKNTTAKGGDSQPNGSRQIKGYKKNGTSSSGSGKGKAY